MVDIVQIVLIIVVVVITTLLVIIGSQIFNILKEFRISMKKINKILDDAGAVSESVAKPIVSLSDIMTGATGITSLLGWFLNRKKGSEAEEND